MKTKKRLRVGSLAVIGVLACSFLNPGAAGADTRPPAGTPPTVSAEPLPTVQVNGVIWAQVTVGDVVYATGSFSKVRPAGSAPGENEQSMANLVAFSITTGELISGFNHSLNDQGWAITASPDGSKVYVGGDFTKVDGQDRGHVAQFNTATGELDPVFHPWVNGRVQAMSATNDTLYIGGEITAVNNVARKNLAALRPNGGLLSWAPTADNIVISMVVVPGYSSVVVGGRFTNLNGYANLGMGALHTVSGDTKPWPVNTIIRNGSANSAITSLSTDGTAVYGGGYAYQGEGNFEGTFAADPSNGELIWLDNCQGDTYGVYPIGEVLYSAGHPHSCRAIGGFPNGPHRRALAETTYRTGTNGAPEDGYPSFEGQPAGSLLHWYPDLSVGSYTGQNQAAFSVTGNRDYLVAGGEFVASDGVEQQGLVRFAVAERAPNKMGPIKSDSVTPEVTWDWDGFHISWQATWDRDNENLSYAVRRNGAALHSVSTASNFWTLPAMSYTDTSGWWGATYTITVTDPFGNEYTTPPVSTG